MTFHSKAATDEIYNMFNQPLKCETKDDTQNGLDSDLDDDDCSTAGESTGTSRISGMTSEFGDDDETVASVRTTADGENTTSQSESVSPWSEFSASKDVPKLRKRNAEGSLSEDVNEILTSSQDNQTQASQFAELDTQAIEAMASEYEAQQQGEVKEEEQELKTPISPPRQEQEHIEVQNKPRYVPLPPEEYEPTPLRPFRDPAAMAQNRLPFMTPIVEKTESSLAPSTAYTAAGEKDEYEYFDTKTPSRSNSGASVVGTTSDKYQSPSKILKVDTLLLNSPSRDSCSPSKRKLKAADTSNYELETSSPRKQKPKFSANDGSRLPENIQVSPHRPRITLTVKPQVTPNYGQNNATRLPPKRNDPLIPDTQCNPVDTTIRSQILNSIHPSLDTYPGFFDRSSRDAGHYPLLQRFAAKVASKPKSSPRKGACDKTVTQAVPPVLAFEGAERVYAVKRELGKGAFAPVYLVESYSQNHSDEKNEDDSPERNHWTSRPSRQNLEAIKTEHPPSAWEFYILRLLRHRLGHMSRTMQSIIQAHECHLFRDECYLVLEYRSQGTLLDLVNKVRSENVRAGKSAEGLDEVLAMFFAVELLRTMEECHRVGVLHGDLKADNCLVRLEPAELEGSYSADGSYGWSSKGLTLIDVGRGIDFRAFRPDVGFVADWKSCDQDCAEIREARPWTWQIDYFGAAGIIHSLLFGKYIETVPGPASGGLGRKKDWKMKDGFKRYWQGDIWGSVFAVLLNPGSVQDGEVMPINKNLGRVRALMETWLTEEGERKGLRQTIRKAESLVGVRKK